MNYKRMNSEDFPDWFVDLLLLRATDGLDESQQRMFDKFVEEYANPQKIELEAEKAELAVAAIDLNFQSSEPEEENTLPEGLRRKVLEGAKEHFKTEPVTKVAEEKVEKARKDGLTSREALAWLAAAAAVTLLLTGWNPFAGPSPSSSGTEIVAEKTAEEKFDDFVAAEEADLIRVPWKATDESSLASGEVVWRDSSQMGFMVFNGLRPNNPLQFQYQLWIFDSKTGSSNPVDGGVFDVPTGETAVIPIDARIPISQPTTFAVTEEIPGGVVVSTQEKLPLLAEVDLSPQAEAILSE
jgi:hypothetical protein